MDLKRYTPLMVEKRDGTDTVEMVEASLVADAYYKLKNGVEGTWSPETWDDWSLFCRCRFAVGLTSEEPILRCTLQTGLCNQGNCPRLKGGE